MYNGVFLWETLCISFNLAGESMDYIVGKDRKVLSLGKKNLPSLFLKWEWSKYVYLYLGICICLMQLDSHSWWPFHYENVSFLSMSEVLVNQDSFIYLAR